MGMKSKNMFVAADVCSMLGGLPGGLAAAQTNAAVESDPELGGLPGGLAAAQTLAYVDARRLIDEAPQGQAELRALEERFSERGRELKGQVEQFKAEEAELQKNAVLMSAEELEEKTRLLRDRQIRLNREQQNYNEDYARARRESLAKLEKLISKIIIELAKEQKIDLVVQQAVYASHEIDLTGKVLERLRQSHAQ